jgi:hypothetical protein
MWIRHTCLVGKGFIVHVNPSKRSFVFVDIFIYTFTSKNNTGAISDIDNHFWKKKISFYILQHLIQIPRQKIFLKTVKPATKLTKTKQKIDVQEFSNNNYLKVN